MKIKFFIILLLFSITFNSAFASGSNNPTDEIYDSIDYWRATGVLEMLPPIRPYPTQYIVSLLNKVIERGTASDKEVAKEYLEYYTKTNFGTSLKSNNFTSFSEHQTLSGVGIDSNIILNDYVTAGIDINGYIINDLDKDVTPPSRSIGIDLNVDNMGFSAFGYDWELQQSLNLNGAFGTDTLWVQTGMMPTSFGPLFSDSVVLNPSAKQAAHFSLTWIHDYFTYSYLFLSLVATDNTGSVDSETDNKYLHIRSFDFKITDFWEFQFLESAIYGGKGVKPIFFLPFSEFFYSAGQGGTWDVNSLIGLSSRFQLPNNISFTATGYLDDINARDVITLDLDTKMKFAAQAELKWTPLESLMESINLSYTAIMPYMYTHITESDEDSEYYDIFDVDYDVRNFALSNQINYENYTNGGVSLGPYGMDPNSDKLALNFNFKLPKGFKLRYSAELQRHGNSSSTEDRAYTLSDDFTFDSNGDAADGNDVAEFKAIYDTNDDGIIDDAIDIDGSIFDSGYGWTGGFQYQDSNPFLSQDVLEIMLLNEIKLITPTAEFLDGEIYGAISYAYVYVDNYDLNEGETYSKSFLSLSFNYTF